jgi:hypothetical protein
MPVFQYLGFTVVKLRIEENGAETRVGLTQALIQALSGNN